MSSQYRTVKRVGPRRRGLSGLGVVFVLLGALALLFWFSVIPHWVLGLWPLILVLLGLLVISRRPGWILELDLLLPGFAGAADRPRRRLGSALAATGLLLLPFTLHLLDDRLIGPIVIILIGAALVWRRAR